jgi:hypothetical protein
MSTLDEQAPIAAAVTTPPTGLTAAQVARRVADGRTNATS